MKPVPHKQIAWLVFATFVLASAPAAATLLRSFDLTGLSREAHVVVRGKVFSQEDRWNEERTKIYRYSTVEVLERVKSERVAARIVVKQIGGTVDGMTMSVPGTADLRAGEEVVLFLRTDGRYHYLVGMHQGKYGVRRDASGVWVTREPLPRVTAAAAVAKEVRPAPAERLTLSDLLRDVARHVRTAPKTTR